MKISYLTIESVYFFRNTNLIILNMNVQTWAKNKHINNKHNAPYLKYYKQNINL